MGQTGLHYGATWLKITKSPTTFSGRLIPNFNKIGEAVYGINGANRASLWGNMAENHKIPDNFLRASLIPNFNKIGEAVYGTHGNSIYAHMKIDSSVGTATGYGLDSSGSTGQDFSLLQCPDPASYSNGTRRFFSGSKAVGA
jgi:hypothetical protein